MHAGGEDVGFGGTPDPPAVGLPSQGGAPSALSWPSDASVLDALDAAVLVRNPLGVVLYANPAAERLYGHPRSALLGSNLRELLVADGQHPRAEDIMQRVLAGETWRGEFEVRHADGRLRTVRVTDSPVYAGGELVAVVGVAEDVTGLQQARRDADRLATRLEQLGQVTTALAHAQDVEAAVAAVVDQAAAALGAKVASLSLLADDGETLLLAGLHGSTRDLQQRWASYRLDAALPASEAVRTGKPVVLADRAELEARYPGLAGALADAGRSTVCLPLTVPDRRLGALSLSFPEGIPDQADLAFLSALADICAQALQRLAALDEARVYADKLAFLAEASVQLAASVDLDTTLTRVAHLAVPRLADWCAIHVAEGDAYRPVAVAHADPRKLAWARELQERYPLDPQAPTGVPRVIATGISELFDDIGEALMTPGTIDDPDRQMLVALGMRTALVVPLSGRRGAFGAITLIAAESGRQFGTDDITLAEELARRAALAVETADAFRVQSAQLAAISRVADAAQQAILAPVPARIGPGLLAARYVSASADALVGGDLYEVVAHGDGIRMIVGDVRGKGLEAVRTATVVLGEFRAAAADGRTLTEMAKQIDGRLAPYLGEEDFVTAVLAELDNDGTLCVATCGHPPVLVARADGLQEIGEPGCLPLGLGARPRDVTVSLNVGDRVLLYTDGLLEARDAEGLFVDARRVVSRLREGSPQAALDQLLASLHEAIGHELSDDLALLLAEYRPIG